MSAPISHINDPSLAGQPLSVSKTATNSNSSLVEPLEDSNTKILASHRLEPLQKPDISPRIPTMKSLPSIPTNTTQDTPVTLPKAVKPNDSKSIGTPPHISSSNTSATSIGAIGIPTTPSTTKSHPATKKKKEISGEPNSTAKPDGIAVPHGSASDVGRASSPPKDSRRKSAKSFVRSAGSATGELNAVSKDPHSTTLSSTTATSHLATFHPQASEHVTPSATAPAHASTQISAAEEPVKRKSGTKKRKSIKDPSLNSILDPERDMSPSTRGLPEAKSNLPSTEHHHQEHVDTTSPLPNTLITNTAPSAELDNPAENPTSPAGRMRKTHSSSFLKESIVSLLTSPAKKRSKKVGGDESDGEKDDSKVIVREPKENLEHPPKDRETKDAKDSKEPKEKDSKESKDAKDAKDLKEAKDRDVKEAKEKDRENKDPKPLKEPKEPKDKDSKDSKDAKDSKDKDTKDLAVTTQQRPDASVAPHALTTPHTGPLIPISSSSNSSVTTKKSKKGKKKTVGKKRAPKVCYLQTIPIEVLLKLLCCLDVPGLINMAITSKLFKGICKEPFVWHVVAVKMMRAGQRKPRIFEWDSYCKSIWCYRKGISLDAEAITEVPRDETTLLLVKIANKALATPSTVTAIGAKPTHSGTGDEARPDERGSSPVSVSHPTSDNSADDPESIKPKSASVAGSAPSLKTPLPVLPKSTTVQQNGTHPSNQIASQTSEEQSDLTLSTATNTGDATSTSEDSLADSLQKSAAATPTVQSPSVVTLPSSSDPRVPPSHSSEFISSLRNGNASPIHAISHHSKAPLHGASSASHSISSADVFIEHLLNILRTSLSDVQTDLSLHYPFLFTEKDGLELRLSASLSYLFKIKQTLSTMPHLVLRAVHLPTREMTVIVKVPYVPGMRPQLKPQDSALMRFLQTRGSPFLVSYYGSYFDGRFIWYLSEFCTAGSCKEHLDGYSSFSESEMASIARDILCGLAVLHKNGFVHGNISASALMLSEMRQGRPVAKLRVKTLLNSLEMSLQLSSTTLARKVYWRAPEHGISPAMDIWSLGVTFIEMVEGKPPGWNMPPQQARNTIVNSPPPSLRHPTSFSAKFRSFLDHCLMKDPKMRPTAAQLLSHPFIVELTTVPKPNPGGTANRPRASLTRFNSSPIASTSRSIVPRSNAAAPSAAPSASSLAPNGTSATTRRPKKTATATQGVESKASASGSQPASGTATTPRRGRTKKAKPSTNEAKPTGATTAARTTRPPKITRRLSYAGSASTSDTLTHPYLSDSEDNISFALTHSSSRLSFSWSEDWASGSVDVSMDSKH